MRSTRWSLLGVVAVVIAVSALAWGCDGSNLRSDRIADTLVPPPEPNDEAKLAALWLSSELVPPDELSQTIMSDLTSIRDAYADSTLLASVTFFPPWEPSEILIRVTPEGKQRIRDGDYEEFDALGDEFGITSIDTAGLWLRLDIASLTFSGNKHPVRLAAAYDALADIEWAEVNRYAGDWSNVYPWEIPNGMSYLFRYAWGDCPAGCIDSIFWYFRVSGGAIEFVGRYVWRDEPEPAWWDEARTAFYAYKS